METSELKNSVLNYVETADERLLKLMEALAESYKNLDSPSVSLSQSQYEILNERRQRHLAGESKSLTWEQVKTNVRNSKK